MSRSPSWRRRKTNRRQCGQPRRREWRRFSSRAIASPINPGLSRSGSTAALALARERTSILDWRRTPSAIRSAPFDGVLLQLFDGGGRLEFPPSDVGAFASGDVVVLDMNRPFRIRAQGAAEAVHVGLWIPTSRFRDTPAAADLQGLRLAAASPGGALLGAGLRALAEQVGAMSEADFLELTQGVADLAHRILKREVRRAECVDPAMELETFLTVRQIRRSKLDVAKTRTVDGRAQFRAFSRFGLSSF